MGKLVRKQRKEEAAAKAKRQANKSTSKAFKAMDKYAAKQDKTPDPTPEQIEQNIDAIKQEEEKDIADSDVFSQSDNGVPRTPDLIQLKCDHPKAPVSGQSHYFVISQTSHRVVLLHPFTLTQCTLPGDEIRGAKTVILGEEQGMTGEKLASLMERLMKEYAARSKQYPEQIVRRLIAALRGLPIHEVVSIKPKRDVPAQFKEKSARRPGVIDAIRELIETPKGASKPEILKVLLGKFPNRAEKGMAHTIDCQLRELPKKIAGVKVLVDEKDKERGKVFRMVPA